MESEKGGSMRDEDTGVDLEAEELAMLEQARTLVAEGARLYEQGFLLMSKAAAKYKCGIAVYRALRAEVETREGAATPTPVPVEEDSVATSCTVLDNGKLYGG